MQKKDGKWFTRKKGAMLVLTLCLVGAAAATTYYAVDLSDTAQEPAKEHMVDLNESPVVGVLIAGVDWVIRLGLTALHIVS